MSQPVPLVVVGAGGHGRSVLELVRLGGTHRVLAFLDDQQPAGADIMGVPVWGDSAWLQDLPARGVSAIHVAIGNNRSRQALCERASAAGLSLTTLVHPRAYVSPSAVLGPGCSVMALAAIGTEAVLGDGAIVNMGAVVDHHARVGAYGHLGTNATMAGGTRIGARAWLQAGSALGYHVHLPDDTVLGPGEGRA
jgi:sugar O-acyltransferase (sialic acid O-acetyltransferase NeuD family)